MRFKFILLVFFSFFGHSSFAGIDEDVSRLLKIQKYVDVYGKQTQKLFVELKNKEYLQQNDLAKSSQHFSMAKIASKTLEDIIKRYKGIDTLELKSNYDDQLNTIFYAAQLILEDLYIYGDSIIQTDSRFETLANAASTSYAIPRYALHGRIESIISAKRINERERAGKRYRMKHRKVPIFQTTKN